MLGPRYPKVSFTSNKEISETPKAPHHSCVCIEDQSNTHISLPPPEPHDPFAHALEESYTTRTLSRRKLSLFLIFSYLSHSRE